MSDEPCSQAVGVRETRLYHYGGGLVCSRCHFWLKEVTQPGSRLRSFIHSGKPVLVFDDRKGDEAQN